jgi:hypothetical protein
MIRSTSYYNLNRKTSNLQERKKNVQHLGNRPLSVANVQESSNENRQVNVADPLSVSSSSAKVKGRKKDALEKFIESPQPLIATSLSQLRHTILCEGLADPCPYRSYIWSILLKAAPIKSEWYSGVVARGEINEDTVGHTSKFVNVGDKIKNDVFRTFQNNKKFWAKTSEAEIIRILNVFAWCVIENKQLDTFSNNINTSDCKSIKNSISPYIQGMNVLAGPFLYVCRSEPQAFTLFYTLLINDMPRYVTPNLHGSMDGVKLVELVLQSVDRKLYDSLSQSISSAKIYALPSVLTLCACTPSLDEVIKLWDFLFSFGVHMNILLVVAQLLLIRSELMNTKTPMNLLRQFPPLNANKIIKLSLSIAKNIPDDLYDLVVRHTFDESVTSDIDNYKVL